MLCAYFDVLKVWKVILTSVFILGGIVDVNLYGFFLPTMLKISIVV